MLPQRTCVALLCTLAALGCASGQNRNGGRNKAVWYRARSLHEGQGLSDYELRSLSALAEKTQQFKAHLDPILVPRVVGTPGHAAVRKHLVDTMLGLDWSVDELAFDGNTPVGHKTFTNVVATLNPNAPRHLVLACHYDSKLDANVFIGATDSAVPCAMLLHLATELNDSLSAHAQEDPDVTLQFIFFDGEEAFRRWTSTDSLYGSRKLAALLNNSPYPRDNQDGTNQLHRMDVMVLLDLLGTEDVSFSNFYRNTEKWYTRMVSYEQRFYDLNLMNRRKRMFQRKNNYNSGIEDDHVPFLKKGVPIVHLIPVPFPKVWHRPSDNKDALHYPTIDNLNRVLFAFTADYLHLQL